MSVDVAFTTGGRTGVTEGRLAMDAGKGPRPAHPRESCLKEWKATGVPVGGLAVIRKGNLVAPNQSSG